nr:outer membrane protein assembly factor BamA [Telmatospirillum sp. J64-1]
MEIAQAGGTIQAIVVEGVQRIEPETVRSYMGLSEGEPFDPLRIDEALKNLFATGLFADVALRREGDTLMVRVVENPIINRIAFEGNRRVRDEVLEREVQLRPRVVFTRTRVQSDVQRLLDIYRRSGRFAATVEPKVIQLEQNRVDLVFEIDEGPATNVQRINIIGNRAFSDSRLREELSTRESRWYRFFSTDDTYDPDRLTFDRELLRRFYLRHGYVDFRVVSAVAELTPDREAFFITFTIEEGERYRVGDVQVDAQLRDLDSATLEPLVLTQTGDWYNADRVENTIQALTDAAASRGYAFAEVRPRLERQQDERVINLVYEILEGPRVYVDRIDIQGNVRTLDRVIRREMQLVEGDAFNAAKLRRSRQRIQDLGFFERVEVTETPSDTAPDRANVVIDVQERSTGELSFGVGWSTSAGPLAEVSVRERNLLGRGQDLRASFSVGERRNQLSLGFTEPYFMDMPVAAGFDLYHINRKLQRESSYDSRTTGGSLRLGYQLDEYLRQDWSYTLRQTTIENVDADASRYIQDQEGTSVLSSVGHSITYDRRDSRLDPTEGYMLRLSTEFAGLGGTETFLRNNLAAAHYWPLADQVVLQVGGTAGYIFGINGKDVRISERYFVGGDDVRGFESAGISPRDPATGDALGGVWSYTGTVQVDFPLGLPQELGFTGRVFTDFGAIGPTEKTSAGGSVEEASSVRLSIGTGVRWRSPMGPINVDFGFPLLKEDFDKTETFRLNFGTRF